MNGRTVGWMRGSKSAWIERSLKHPGFYKVHTVDRKVCASKTLSGVYGAKAASFEARSFVGWR